IPDSYGASKSRAAYAALQILGGHLLNAHHDRWLEDFLESTPKSQTSAVAVSLLARAVRANLGGNPDQAHRLAAKANVLFVDLGSVPGSLEAQVEQINSFRQQFRSRECINAGRRIEGILEKRGY